MSLDRTGESHALAVLGSRYRVVRPVSDGPSVDVVVEDPGDGGRRRLVRVVPDRPEIRAAADAARRVTHDHLVGLLRIEPADDGRLLLVSNAVEGETVAGRIRRLGSMHEDLVLRLMTSVARALDRAHTMGVVHGLLTTESIVIDEDGEGMLSGLAVDAALAATGDDVPTGGAEGDVVAFARIIVGMLDGVSNPPPGAGVCGEDANADDDFRGETHRALRRAAARVLDPVDPRVPRTCGEFLMDVTAVLRSKRAAEAEIAAGPGAPSSDGDRFSSPVELLTLESAIADLVPRRSRLRLGDHTAIRTAWEKGEHFLSSGSVYKQLQRWEAAGQALEMAKNEFDLAFTLDRRLQESRTRHAALEKVESSLPRPDHPDVQQRHARVDRMLAPETGDWWTAWEDGRLDEADRVLDEVVSILGEARHRDREIESALRLRSRWADVAARVPDRTLDRRFAMEIQDHRAAGARAGEAFDRGCFGIAGGCWAVRLARFEAVLEEEARAHEEAVEARRAWHDARSRTPQSRPISRNLQEALARLDAESDRVEREAFAVGDHVEAIRVWSSAADSIGGLVQDDVERFGRVEAAREAHQAVWASTPSRRTCTHLADEFRRVHELARSASTAREEGDFDHAIAAWTEAATDLRRLLDEDVVRHREALLACERLGRRLEMLPARSLDRSVRADIERARQRFRVMHDWKAQGRFVEVQDAVARAIDSIDRAVETDTRKYEAAVRARDEAAAFAVEEPADVPPEVHDRMRPAQDEIEAAVVQARQAFDLGEYADCADAWRRFMDLRRRFAEDLHREVRRHERQRRRAAFIRWSAVAMLVLAAGFAGVAMVGYSRLSGLRTTVVAAPISSDRTPQFLIAERDALITDLDAAMTNPVEMVEAAIGPDGWSDRWSGIDGRARTADEIDWVGLDREAAALGDIDDLPEPLRKRIADVEAELARLKSVWNAEGIDPAGPELQEFTARQDELTRVVEATREARHRLDELEEVGRQGAAAAAGLPEILEGWATFDRDLTFARDDWEAIGTIEDVDRLSIRLDELEAQARMLRDRRLAIRAEAARDAFRDVWTDGDFEPIRRAMLDLDVEEVSRLDRQADEDLEASRAESAAEAWVRATTIIDEAERVHRPAVERHRAVQERWDGRVRPTDPQRKDNLFKGVFNEAERRAEEGVERAGEGRFDMATRKMESALEHWNEGLERVKDEIELRWRAIEDDERPIEDRHADAVWLAKILPAGTDDQRRAKQLRDRLYTRIPSYKRPPTR